LQFREARLDQGSIVDLGCGGFAMAAGAVEGCRDIDREAGTTAAMANDRCRISVCHEPESVTGVGARVVWCVNRKGSSHSRCEARAQLSGHEPRESGRCFANASAIVPGYTHPGS